MNRPTQQEKAETLLALHTCGPLLLLPNVWNPIGARVLERQGYPAVATASAAIAASLGYQDGEKIRKRTALDIIERIAHSVDVPVTADIEAGYATTLAELEETAEEVLATGVAGVNIEDGLEEGAGLRGIDEQCRRIATLRSVAARRGVPLVINARIDSYHAAGLTSTSAATDDAVSRALAYVAAGADCVYPIGPGDETTVRQLRQRITAPLNILATPQAAPLGVLQKIGVNRVSCGPFLFRACLRTFVDIAAALREKGDYACFKNMLSRAEVDAYLRRDPE